MKKAQMERKNRTIKKIKIMRKYEDQILELMKLTKRSVGDHIREYKEADGDMENFSGGKKKKEKKIFKVGDIIICIKTNKGKLSDECLEFLKTYKYFKILNVNESFNIDIGYVTPDGKNFYFSSNRFELKDKPKEISKEIPTYPKIENILDEKLKRLSYMDFEEKRIGEIHLNQYVIKKNNY